LLLAGGLAVPLRAATADPSPDRLSLSQAIEQALAANPEVRVAREQVAEFRLQVREVRSEALPKLDLTLSAQHSRDPGLRNSPSFKELAEFLPPEALEPLSFSTYAYRLDLEQPLFTFGRVSHALKVARQELSGVETDARAVENMVARDVALAYYDLLLATKRLSVLETERAARERQLEKVEARLALEDATRLDVLNARVALANLKPQILAAETGVHVARVRLNELMGRPVSEPVTPADSLDLPSPGPQIPGADTLAAAAAQARPELLRFAISRRGLKEARGVYRADVLPRVTGNASFGVSSYRAGNLGDFGFRSWMVGASMTWKLFDGLRTQSTLARLRSQVKQSQLREEAFRASLERELAQAVGEWERGLEAVSAAEVAVDQAHEAESLAEESFKWGAATVLDLLEAERAVREAELTLAQGRHAALTALASIKHLVGLRADENLEAGLSSQAPATE